MKRLINDVARKFGFEIRRYSPAYHDRKVVSLSPEGESRGNMLMSYIIEPFLVSDESEVSRDHTHDWESLQIARTFLALGYAVDVIDYRNGTFVPEKRYDYFLSARTNLQRIAERLNEDCVKIAHLDTAHWLYNNSMALRRCLQVLKGRRIALKSFRLVDINWAIESADCGTILGNGFTMDTYRYAEKPLYRVPISTCCTYPWPAKKNFDGSRRNFMWFGSSGLVHKGLDLVLETFSEMPDHRLFVCGPIGEERAFEKAYHKALYETPNIETVGWVDVAGRRFAELAESCCAIIYPSCSEGGGGCVIQCMHAGLIPVVSRQASVDVDEGFGIVMERLSVGEIEAAVRRLSALPAGELRRMSRGAWRFAREKHTREHFAAAFRKTVLKIMANHGSESAFPAQASGDFSGEEGAVEAQAADSAFGKESV